MRSLGVVTGSRAEYGLLRPVLRAIVEHPELQLHLVVTGMHLSEEHGRSIEVIRADGFPIAAVVPFAAPAGDPDPLFERRGRELGRGVIGLVSAFGQLRPEVVVVLGDRLEAFAAACSAMACNLFLAHIHGGDRSLGGQDEAMRHAITRLAHIHFAASAQSAERLRRMGEDPERIFTVGAPGLDAIAQCPVLTEAEVRARWGFLPEEPYLVAVLHPISTQPEEAAAAMREFLAALESLAVPTLLLYPNDDPGYEAMLQQLEAMKSKPWLRVARNLAPADYLGVLRYAAALVGNSSSGMFEAPALGTPVVNVGERQSGREHGPGVVHVPLERHVIVEGVRAILKEPRPVARPRVIRAGPFGDGTAGRQIAQILATVPLSAAGRQKRLAY